jgi:CDP-glucose 4,6-dehydratase
MRTAFVTGAQGLLGSWLVRALLERDVRVVVLTRADRPASALHADGLADRCVQVRGDVLDAGTIEAALAANAVDTVFHLAAQPILSAATGSPVQTFETNVRGTWQVLEAARTHGVGAVVVVSTDRVHRAGADGRCDEGSPLDPPGPYEASKAAADLVAASFARTGALRVAIGRCSNVFGGGDLHPSRLVPAVSAALVAGRAPVIWSDGTPERDYLHAQDAAAGLLAIAGALEDGQTEPGEVFHVGGGHGRSVREVVDALIAVAGATVRPDVRGTPVAGAATDRHVGDPSKLRARTGWAPQVPLADGLRRTLDWYREHPGALAS